MSVLALTILVSSCLAGVFIACFAAEIRRSRHSSTERESLLPLMEDDPPGSRRNQDADANSRRGEPAAAKRPART